MKNLLSKNWKRIIYIVSVGFIIYNIVTTILTKNTIIDDYYIYGPDYQRPNIVVEIDGRDIKEGEETLTSTLVTEAEMPEQLARGVIFLAIGIVALLIFGNLTEGGSAPAKKK